MGKIPVYFLPGTMCDERIWQDVFSCLPSNIDPIYVSIPLGDDLDAIIYQLETQLPITPFNLIGFSLGGYLAALFAVRNPGRIKRLLISANSPSTLPIMEIAQRKIAINVVEKFGYQGIPQAKIVSLLATNNKDNKDIIGIIAAMDEAGGVSKLLSQLRATSMRENLFPTLAKLSVPIHFVYGDQDRLVTHTKITEICDEQITSTVIKNCGHMIPLEKPQQLSQQIVRFFSSNIEVINDLVINDS